MTAPLTLRVAARHLRAVQTIDKSDVERWKRDLRRMTQIYKSIDPDDVDTGTFEEARKLFINFRDNFKEWVYGVLLPKKSDKSSVLENDIRSKAWDALHSLADIFPTQWGASEATVSAPWLLKSVREKNIRRYQKAFLDTFKLIEEYLGEGAVHRPEAYQQIDISGTHLVINSTGREDYEDKIEDLIRDIRSYIASVHRVGFGNVAKGVTLILDFSRDSNAGEYDFSSDTITLYVKSMIGMDGHVLWHELGHRFWYRFLPPNAKEHWEEVMSSRSIHITRTDVNNFVEDFAPELQGYDSKQLLRAVRDDVVSPELLAKYEYLVEHTPGYTTDLAKIKEHYADYIGNKVDLEHISDYGATKPTEAFAECLRIIIEEGWGKLGPWTQAFFKEISRSGGAKLATLH